MNRFVVFAYGLLCYLMFLGVFLYALGFVGDFLVPKSIDRGGDSPIGIAAIVNTGLLLAFGLQHSIMARPTFKRWWTRIIPEPAERSTYVLASNLCMIALFIFWQPMTDVVWDVRNTAGRAVLWTLFAAGWGLVLITTLLINHLDLFGLRQVWLHLRGKPYTSLGFVTPGIYRVIRHPLYVGWITAFWAIPTMTVGHLLFAAVVTAYILVAIVLEERNLAEYHGEEYIAYQRRTGKLIPRFWRASPVGSKPQSPSLVHIP